MLGKVAGLYEPDLDLQKFMRQDAATKQKIADLDAKIADFTKGVIQPLRDRIIAAIEALVAARPEVLTITLVSTGARPLNSLLEKLRKPGPIEPKELMSLLSDCSTNHVNDTFTQEEDTLARGALALTLRRSYQLGSELQAFFAPFIVELQLAESHASPLKIQRDKEEKELHRVPPYTKANMALRSELQGAINKVKDKADADKRGGVTQALSISRLCTDLLGKIERREPVNAETVDTITAEYGALKDKRSSDYAYACPQMDALKRVLNAHQANLALFVDQAAFDKYVLEHSTPATATASASGGAASASGGATSTAAAGVVVGDANQQLSALLTEYIRTRSLQVDAQGVPLQYLHGEFFKSLKNSLDQEKAAIKALQAALQGTPTELTRHLKVLRYGGVGTTIRSFAHSGKADSILDGKKPSVTGLVEALEQKYPPPSTPAGPK